MLSIVVNKPLDTWSIRTRFISADNKVFANEIQMFWSIPFVISFEFRQFQKDAQ